MFVMFFLSFPLLQAFSFSGPPNTSWHDLKAIYRPLDCLVVQVSLELWGCCSGEGVHSSQRACRACGTASPAVTTRPRRQSWSLSGTQPVLVVRHVVCERLVSETVNQWVKFSVFFSSSFLFIYLFVCLFIYGCVGSWLLHAGFL